MEQVRVAFETYGCKVNQAETAGLQQLFAAEGFRIVSDADEAEVLVINSCTVTAAGDSKAHSAIRRSRRRSCGQLVVLIGCFPQAYPEAAAQSGADLIAGTADRRRLPSQVKALLEQQTGGIAVTPYSRSAAFEALPCGIAEGHTRAFLKIQDGCSRRCSYCAIPSARGPSRSMPLSRLRSDLELLAQQGCREVVLTGINLGFYGLEEGVSLGDAVRIGCDLGLRMRLGSLEPDRLTLSLLDAFAQCTSFCPQFHLSLQSGCDSVLRRMYRPHSCAEYLTLCREIRKRFPNAGLTTDLMVGFPGETEEEFSETLRFAEQVGFAGIHGFSYSPRPGTPAASLVQLPESIKTARAARLKALSRTLSDRFLASQTGQTVPVLFERRKSPLWEQGHAPNGILVKIPAKNIEKGLRNQVFYVTIKEIGFGCCIGSLDSGHAPE